MKTLKMILLTAIIAVPLYIAIADPFFWNVSTSK